MPRKALAETDPRVAGGRYLCGYWRQEYTVTGIETRDGIRWLTCQWHAWTAASHPGASDQWSDPGDAQITTHCTAWDARRDLVISQPETLPGPSDQETRTMITTPDHCRITRDSIAHALDLHEQSGNITRWLDWHEDRPSRKHPLYTVTLAGPPPVHVIDLSTLHEAHAFCAGLASAEFARTGTVSR